jgi:hypothetical protein
MTPPKSREERLEEALRAVLDTGCGVKHHANCTYWGMFSDPRSDWCSCGYLTVHEQAQAALALPKTERVVVMEDRVKFLRLLFQGNSRAILDSMAWSPDTIVRVVVERVE